MSEHQPPAWPSYFTDIHILVLLVPAGLAACFRPLSDASLFLILYGVTAVYFSGVMVIPCILEAGPLFLSPCNVFTATSPLLWTCSDIRSCV